MAATVEADLLDRTSALGCEVPADPTGVFDAAAVAGVICAPAESSVDRLTIQAFADAAALDDHWQRELDADTPALEETEDACRGGAPGSRAWGNGAVACLIDEGRAQVRWTDERTSSYGTAEGADDDLAGLYRWWRQTARPLGQSTDTGPAEPQETDPAETPRPLVRVPGQPRAITCDAAIDPIADVWEREWRIRNVEFRSRGGFERVIINLERAGRNDTDRPTQAIVERMPASDVARAVEGASSPGRGQTAIVVRLDGITDAPDLRSYRPTAVALVRELSIARGGGSRTVILSTTQDTCYQVRVPVWSNSATGRERRAEIFVDLEERPGS